MFAFGNESNYGLSWSSFEIENLPVGEQNKAKAVFLYTLWNEVIEAGKALDSNHPFTIVNGDIQYIDLIAEHVTDDGSARQQCSTAVPASPRCGAT
jgi:beta-galactosidase